MKQHWESIYTTKAPDEVSWYQRRPSISVDLIRRVALSKDAAIIDVGGGASALADTLIASGYTNVTVCDIAEAALRHVHSANRLCADILTATLSAACFDVWHDRAVFHFFTSAADRTRYVEQVTRALRPGGHAIVATFAEDGPTRCSGLDVVRYSSEKLHAEFGEEFALVDAIREDHVTPSGATQQFQYCVCTYRKRRE